MATLKRSIFVLICLAGTCLQAAEQSGKVLQHTSITGNVCSAVILKGVGLSKPKANRQHIVLIDTSASQVGEHRQQALSILEALLKTLPDTDQVRLFAVDLQAEPLDDGFHDVRSPAVAEGIELLKQRVPLGATNLEGVLRAAMKAAGDRPTDITYIGDGMSTADLIEVTELRSLVGDLRRQGVPVHSFGVGSQKNLQILGILAQQTGGFIGFDALAVESAEEQAVKAKKTKSAKLASEIARVNRSAAERAAEQGKSLATAMNAPVFIPVSIKVNPEISLLPADPLPIRTDRETIYAVRGTVPENCRISLTNAEEETLEWKLPAPVEQPGATFLNVMTGQLEDSGGLTNPLAGMQLFLMSQSDFSDNITAMAQRGAQLLQQGEIDQATKISVMVFEAEPNNEAAKILKKSLEQLKSQPKPADPKPSPNSRKSAK